MKFMRNLTVMLLCIAAVSASAHADLIYGGDLYAEGSLSYGNGLKALSGTSWASSNTHIDWKVYTNIDEQNVTYYYRFEVDEKSPSHFIFQLSDSFTQADLIALRMSTDSTDDISAVSWTDISHDGIGTFGPGDPSNPGIPDDMYGIKFDADPDTMVFHFELVTQRMPVWGDFYVKGGKEGKGQSKVDLALSNTGFTSSDTDPLGYVPFGGTSVDHIAVPDTVDVPEPAMIALLAVGGIAILRKRKSALIKQ